MNYKTLWRGLKANFEDGARSYGDRVKSFKPTGDKKYDKALLEELKRNEETCENLLRKMASLENAQTKSEAETIETAIEEFRIDKQFGYNRIKCLRFERYDKEKTWEYACEDVCRYCDYHLYENGILWVIVFHQDGRLIKECTFDRVSIVYYDGESK